MTRLSIATQGLFLLILLLIHSLRSGQIIPIIELSLTIILLATCLIWQSYRAGNQILDSSPSYKSLGIRFGIGFGLIVVMRMVPGMIYYLPLVFYQLSFKDPTNWVFLFIFVWVSVAGHLPFLILFLLIAISLLATLVHELIRLQEDFQVQTFHQIDELRQVNRLIQEEKQQILHYQDLMVQSSVRTERRRIVSELHDILGHQLSSVIIQLAALDYSVESDEMRTTLRQVKDVVDQSMQNVRLVIHAEKASSLDLEGELQTLAQNFHKCPLVLVYDNSLPPSYPTVASIINIVKEGLTNINKHSNATHATIRFTEVPDEWILLISDNGQVEVDSPSQGIGLMVMEERVQSLQGSIHLSKERGFKIYIRIPKEGNT